MQSSGMVIVPGRVLAAVAPEKVDERYPVRFRQAKGG
jgi:hypothetical protein